MKKYRLLVGMIVFNLFLLTPSIIFAQTVGGPGGLVKCWGTECTIHHVFLTIDAIIQYLVGIGVAFVGITIAYTGYLYMTSNGDTGKISQANGMFTKAAIGLVVALSAFLFVKLLLNVTEVNEGELMIRLEDRSH